MGDDFEFRLGPGESFVSPVPAGKFYLAGPMTGIPGFNFDEFDRVATRLRDAGWDIISPAELDTDEQRKCAQSSPDGDGARYLEQTGLSHADLLARDFKVIDRPDVVGVILLAGWLDSQGALREAEHAAGLGKVLLRHVRGSSVLAEPVAPATPARFVRAAPWASAHAVGRAPLTAPSIATSEVRVTNQRTGGEKGQKPQRFGLLPWPAVAQIAEVYAFGASKYADHNWLKGYDWSLSFDAMMRHVSAFWAGEDADPESGLPHMAHAGFHVLALLTFAESHAELDDRPSHPARGAISCDDPACCSSDEDEAFADMQARATVGLPHIPTIERELQ